MPASVCFRSLCPLSLSLGPPFIPSRSLPHHSPFHSCSFPLGLCFCPAPPFSLYLCLPSSLSLFFVARGQKINIIESEMQSLCPRDLDANLHLEGSGRLKRPYRGRGMVKTDCVAFVVPYVCCLWTLCIVNSDCLLFPLTIFGFMLNSPTCPDSICFSLASVLVTKKVCLHVLFYFFLLSCCGLVSDQRS